MNGHYTPNDNFSSGGVGGDDDGKSPAFHTPEQHQHQQNPYSASSSKKRSASELLHPESSGSGSGGGGGSDSSGDGGGGWGITRLVMSLTPWRSRSSSNKRSRTSLDEMSGSAIKRLVNQTDDSPAAETTHVGGVGAFDNNNEDDIVEGGKSSGYMSDGVKTSGTKLGKLNLEAKFDGSGGGPTGGDNNERRNVSFLGVPTPPSQQQQGRRGGSSVLRVQQLVQPSLQQQYQLQQQQQQQQSLVQGGSVTKAVSNPSELPVKKRVRIFDGGDDSRGAAAAMQSSPYHQFAASVTNDGSTIPTFQIGSNGGQMQQQQYSKSPVQFRNVHGRRGTPAGKFASSSSSTSMSMQQRLGHSTAGSTPGLRKVGGTRLTSAAATGGMGERGSLRATTTTTAPNALLTASAQRRSTTAPTLSSRRSAMATSGFNYHRIPLNARSYKPPMSRLLTAAYHSTEGGSTSNGGGGNKSVMLTDSIVSQIVADNQNKLFLSSSNGDLDSGRLFGDQKIVVSTKRKIRGSEEEETLMISDGTNSGMVVPRVRMNRILGSGQTGGRRFAVAEGGGQQSGYLPTSDAADNTTNEPTTKRSVTFQVPHAMNANREDATHTTTPPADANPSFVPYNAAILTPRFTPSGLKITPSKCELSMEEGLEIDRLINSDEFKKMPRMLDPTCPPSSTSPKKKKKKMRRQGTPHPSKKSVDASAMSTPALLHRADRVIAAAGSTTTATTPAGAPFNFMSGGAAASSVVNTPMAYKFGDKKSTPAPSLPATSCSPPAAASSSTASAGASTVPPTKTPKPSASGWGDCFKSEPGEWNCDVCSAPNPKEQSVCLACTAPKKSGSDGGTGSSTTTTSTPSTYAGAGAIGPGGFSFGGKSSSSAATSSSSGVATGPNPYTPNANSTSQPIPSFSGGLGDLFKLKPGEWKCGTCSCKNSASDSKCGDCGTPRDNGAGSQKTDGGIDGAAAVNDNKASIGASGFSFGGATLPSSGGGAISSGGFSFGAATATSTATTPAKPKRSRVDASDDDAPIRAPVVGFSFGAGAPSSSTSTTKAASSIGFSFGATSSGDEKKEDPVTATPSSTAGGFSFSAGASTATTSSTPASKPAFSFGLTPQPNAPATGTIGKKDEASEPSSNKAMFSFGKGSFGKGSDSGSTEERRVSFPSATVAKEDSAPSTKPTLSFGNMEAPTKPSDVAPAILPAPDTNIGSKPSTTAAFSFGAKVADSTSAPAPLFSFGAPASTAAKKNDTPSLSSQPSFPFGTTSSIPTEPSTQNSAITPVAPFTFGSTASTAPSSSGASFAFGSGPPTTTPAPSATSFPTSTAGSMFGAGSNPSAFGTMPGGFGSASQPSAPAPMPATPGTTFSFGMGSTSTPATGGFGTTPNFGFGSAPPQPTAPTPTTGAFGMNVNPMAPHPTPGFAGNQTFGANVVGGFTPQPTSGDGGGVGSFSIGSGARSTGQGAGRGAGRGTARRIIKAKRPNM